jgi:hypothetical protein
VTQLGGELTVDERNLLIETELEKVCQDVLDVLDESLIPKAESGESKVFYHKMYVFIGDDEFAPQFVAVRLCLQGFQI